MTNAEQTIAVLQEQLEQIIAIEEESGEKSVDIASEPITITGTEPYEGEYHVTPTQSTQTLLTEGLRMTQNVTIDPIPSNYGLITWNGSIITVS